MSRMKPVRPWIFLTAGVGALVVLVGGYGACKIYHQMHTPVGVLVIDERR